jgi:DNA mismatch repair ATPase MutL
LDKLNEELHSLKQQLKFNQELETIRTSIQSQVKVFSVKEKEFNEKKKNLEALKNEIDSKNNENLAYSTAPESLKDREYDLKIFSDTLIERKKLESLREDILTLNHQEKTLQKQLESKMEEEASARTNLLKAEKTWYLNHGGSFTKKSSLIEIGLYDESKRRAQDLDLWDRMYLAGMKLHNIHAYTYNYRLR